MKIGFCTGCFDVLHDGHRRFLREARMQCEYLVVAVNHDAYCTNVKGPDRPIESLAERMGAVSGYLFSIGYVGYAVIPFNGAQYELIEEITPSVIFIGHDQKQTLTVIPTVRIDKFGDFSTSSLEAKEQT
jgi:D-beta-D-heptose 7-phosphate kinase/D-beta-D-heptose 1-phosphate adenosyltransferase